MSFRDQWTARCERQVSLPLFPHGCDAASDDGYCIALMGAGSRSLFPLSKLRVVAAAAATSCLRCSMRVFIYIIPIHTQSKKQNYSSLEIINEIDDLFILKLSPATNVTFC
jgi:hypothetical protein